MDSAKRCTTIQEILVNNVVKAKTGYGYDAYGNINNIKRYKDGFTTYAESQYTYGNGANLTEIRHLGLLNPEGAAAAATPGYSAGIAVTRYLGNRLTEKTAYAAGRGLAYSQKWEYDYAGRIVKAYNADGYSSTATYNALGHRVAATDYANTATNYTYDNLGRLLEKKALIENTSYQYQRYYYDPAGNTTSERVNNNQGHHLDAYRLRL